MESLAFEPIVFASRFISCTRKSIFSTGGLFGAQERLKLVEMAAQTHGFFRHGDLIRKNGGFGQNALLVDRGVIQYLAQLCSPDVAVFRDGLRERSSICPTMFKIVSARDMTSS